MGIRPSRRAVPVVGLVFVVAACGGGPAVLPSPTPTPELQPATPTPLAPSPLLPGPTPSPAATVDPGLATPVPSGATPTPGGGVVLPPGGGGAQVNIERFATGVTPAGWVEVLSNDGACRFAAPPDWHTDIVPGAAQSLAFEASALMGHDSISQFGGSWPAYVELVRSTFIANEVVLFSTDERFLMRSPGTEREVVYLGVINRGSGACTLLANIGGNWVAEFEPVVAQLLETMAAVP